MDRLGVRRCFCVPFCGAAHTSVYSGRYRPPGDVANFQYGRALHGAIGDAGIRFNENF